MAIARVVSFEDVDAGRMMDLQQRLDGGERPEGMPPMELIVLHDAGGGRALVVQVFDSEQDYAQGEAVLEAMPAGDTPGRRAAVGRYEVAARVKG
jgi:hypothetical protein